jgi:hypothetical protein
MWKDIKGAVGDLTVVRTLPNGSRFVRDAAGTVFHQFPYPDEVEPLIDIDESVEPDCLCDDPLVEDDEPAEVAAPKRKRGRPRKAQE